MILEDHYNLETYSQTDQDEKQQESEHTNHQCWKLERRHYYRSHGIKGLQE